MDPDDRLALGQDARRVIHDDLVGGLLAALGAGLALGLVAGLFMRVPRIRSDPLGRPESMSELTFALMVGLAVGLATMVGLWLSSSWGRYATASLLFAFTEIFPRRPVRFLEWARDSGLLRVTGIAYQFRHDTYQQWLGTSAVDRGVKTTLDAHAGGKHTASMPVDA